MHVGPMESMIGVLIGVLKYVGQLLVIEIYRKGLNLFEIREDLFETVILTYVAPKSESSMPHISLHVWNHYLTVKQR